MALETNPACPNASPLDPGPNAEAEARAASTAAVPKLYGSYRLDGWQIKDAYPALPGVRFGQIAYGMCGDQVGSRTWVVELEFPAVASSATLSQGVLFVARFQDGWSVWYQYQ